MTDSSPQSKPYNSFLTSWISTWLTLTVVMSTLQILCQRMGFSTFYVRHGLENPYYLRCYLSELFWILLISGFVGFGVEILCHGCLNNRARAWWIRSLATIPVIGFLLSWTVYLNQSVFIDADAIRFFMEDWWRLVQHALHQSDSSLIGVFVNTILLIAGLALLKWVFDRAAQNRGVRLSLLVILPTLLLVAGLFKARAYTYRDAKDFGEFRENRAFISYFLSVNLNYRSHLGPLTTLVFSLTEGPDTPWSDLVHNAEGFEAVYPELTQADVWMDKAKTHTDTSGYRPNVILIIIESLRAEMPFMAKNSIEVMPNIRSLLPRSAYFTNHRSTSSHSSYSDIVPLSGLYPMRSRNTHYYGRNVPYPRVRIYDILKPMGYRTAIISSQDERWGGMHRYLESDQLDAFIHAGNTEDQKWDPEAFSGDSGFERFVTSMKNSGKIRDAATVESVVHWIEQDPEKPFFVYMNLQDSHFPYNIPEDSRVFSTGEGLHDLGFNRMTHDMLPEMTGRYMDSLHGVDRTLRRLLDYLESTGQMDRSIIVVIGDTGQSFLEHGYSNHGGPMYGEVIRTPFILKLDKTNQRYAGRHAFATSHVDIVPTLLDLIGLDPYPGVQGNSVIDWIGSKVDPIDVPPVFLTSQTPLAHQHGIIQSGYKLLFNQLTGEKELFDLENDPGELINIHQDLPEVSESMEARLRFFIEHQLAYYSDTDKVLQFFPPQYYFPKIERHPLPVPPSDE